MAFPRWYLSVFSIALALNSAAGDDLLYRYEGDVLPYSIEGGWIRGQPCDAACREFLAAGHFGLRWEVATQGVGYSRWIARAPVPPPATLWIEWRFASNHPFVSNYLCDAEFFVDYKLIGDKLLMFGDAVISFDGGDVLFDLPNDEFRTYRFESSDGIRYCFFVDGQVFTCGAKAGGDDFHEVRFGGDGGCDLDLLPTINRWDFIRYGTIDYGEQIVSSEPLEGFVNARVHPTLDRFTVTFDQSNYLYIDEIAVEVTAGVAPFIVATRRLDNGPPDVVEIVLDQPIPYNATTRFTIDDGTVVQTVELTYAPGDTDGDGDADLHDFAAFQNCFGSSPVAGVCLPLDFNADSAIDLLDFAAFQTVLIGD